MDKRKQSIVLVDLGASMGGVEAYLDSLAKILVVETDLYALVVLEELAQKLNARGVKVLRVPVFRRIRLLRFAVATAALIYLLLRYRIQVVQINGFLESLLLIPARLFGRKTVYTRHGPFELDLFSWYRQPHKYLPRMCSRYGASLASKLVCVSETVGSLCRPMFSGGQVEVIPNWVAETPKPRTIFANEGRSLQVLCAGRLEKYKGVQLLIEAARGLDGVEINILGDGAYRSSLTELATTNVHFFGFQKDIASWFSRADIVVMPSMGPEGLPMVAIEAMSFGLPCIFSDLPVHCEITDNGRGALLFKSGNANDLREKLETLLASESERERIGKNAFEIVRSKYSEPSARSAYLSLFAFAE